MPLDRWESLLQAASSCNVVYTVAPAIVEQPVDWTSAIEESLHSPCKMPPLSAQVDGESTVVILADDATRPTPQDKILPPLINHLNAIGVPDEAITILIALGTHRYMRRAEMRQRYGQDICGRVNVFNHTWRDESSLINVGQITGGQPLCINTYAAEADFLIGVGSIVPHIWAGWGGGSKILLPGISSPETIAPTHAMAEHSHDLLNISGHVHNPCRRTIKRAAQQAGLNMILNCVVDRDRRPVWIGAGDPVMTHCQGVEAARCVFVRPIPQRAEIILADARPATTDYWQGVKALAHATRGVRENGVIILRGSFPNGISSTHAEFGKLAHLSPRDVTRRAERGEITDPVIITTLRLHTSICDRYNVICLSDGLTPTQTRRLGFHHAENPSDALTRAHQMAGPEASLGIIEYASNVLADISTPMAYNT